MIITIETSAVEITNTVNLTLYRAAFKLHIDDRELTYAHEQFYVTAEEAEREAVESLGNIVISLWGEVRYFGFNSFNSLLDLDGLSREIAQCQRELN